ncbi:MAG: tRNA (adenosine(37)-N6)-threonylcarbamoyltransferase complex ATPase subunit type 1 TsaE [Roseiflexaceae bacterium]|jgi:tRNA threonylcarbamoyladenosine biosynthesis protein TsaE
MTQSSWRTITTDVQQTIELGMLLGRVLQCGDMLLLSGDLGAGKTHLTKGIVMGAGSHDAVTSPTFVFINEYRTASRHTLYHVDLYRIDSPAELDGIGLADATAGHGIAIIEWPERDLDLYHMPHLLIHIHHRSATNREIICTAHGQRAHTLIDYISAHWPYPGAQHA